MKKLIALMLVFVMCLPLASCGFLINMKAIAVAAEPMSVTYMDYYENGEYQAFLEKITDFSTHLTESVCDEYGQNENAVISPISIYMALALAVECTTGETRQEILEAVGVTYDEVNSFTKMLYGFANTEYKQESAIGISQSVARQELFNSIWLDDGVEFIREGVDKLASDYNCDVYKSSFESGEAERLINMYINDKSHGLLEGDIKLSPETYFVLMNTYYLKDVWNELGNDLSFTDEKIYFQNIDGFTHTDLLQGYYNEGKQFDGDRFSSFFTVTDHGFKIYFFVPEEEWSVNSIFTAENISAVLSIDDWGAVDDENMQIHYTRVLFPEFDADFSEDISGVLRDDFKIERLFNPLESDPSTVTVEPVYCEGVIHKAALKVDKKGIEGAAATVMPMCGAAAPPTYEMIYHDFTVVRSFGFVLTDSYGTVLFSGIINSIE